VADGVFNIALGAVVEMFNDSGSAGIIMLLKANEAEATLVDRTDIADLLAEAGNTEADFTNYVRKTGLTGTVTVDNTNELVDVDVPDQTFSAAGGASNNTLTKAIVCYENAAADATRIPLTHHDFAVTTDGNDLELQVATAGFFRAT
jgi:hypothetical protein